MEVLRYVYYMPHTNKLIDVGAYDHKIVQENKFLRKYYKYIGEL